jgi:hypothetical protein
MIAMTGGKRRLIFRRPLRRSHRFWGKGSKRHKEIGLDAYFEENKGESHYLCYKKSKMQRKKEYTLWVCVT